MSDALEAMFALQAMNSTKQSGQNGRTAARHPLTSASIPEFNLRRAHSLQRGSLRLATVSVARPYATLGALLRELRWKNSAWLATADTIAGWNGFEIRNAGSGRSPVRKRSG